MPTQSYTVQRGDTLYGIANKYGITVEELKQLNNLNNNTLYIGQILNIPIKDNNILPDENPIEEYEIYEVVKGDSLWLIAKRYGITVDDLIKLNNLTTLNLQIGDKLKVPKKETERTYIVKNGDTLWSIAKNNNISVEELKQLNNLTSNLLTIGQTLIIPIKSS